MPALAGVLALTVAAPLAGQTRHVVVPPAHASSEATGGTNVPFGRSVGMRAQHLYDGTLFDGDVTISALAMRGDDGLALAAKVVDLEVRLSSFGGPVTWLQARFDRNTGGDETVVLGRRKLSLPAQAAGKAPLPFSLRLPFDRSFRFSRAGRALVVDLRVHGQPRGAYRLDSTWTCPSQQIGYGPPGCGPSGGQALAVGSPNTSVLWGRPLRLQIRNARPSALAAMFFGSKDRGSFGGYTFPVELDVLGAPGCWLSIDALAVLGGTANASGVVDYGFSVPSRPELQTQWLRFQGVAIDTRANALGLVTSQPVKLQICGWEPVARVFANGVDALDGARELGVAPVVELDVLR